MGLFSKKVSHKAGQVDKSRLPRHIAIIMDGNGRWAKKRGLPRTAGHKVGAETFRKIALQCKALGVEYLTIYAFSTENWKRPAEEVSTLMSLLKKYMQEAIDTMERDKMKLRFFGDLSALSPELQDLARRANAVADRVDGFQANLCINYGGRDEILHAAKLCAAAGEEMTEENLEKHLYSRYPRPGAYHSPRRGAAAEQFPAVAVRVFGVLLLRYPVAGFRRKGPG